VERLLAQVDQQAEEVVDAIMGSGVVSPAGAKEKGPRTYGVIKLGVDVHLDRYVVVRQIDGGAPQPAQRFTPAQFLEWTKKQTELAHKVYSCYEAGPFGYSLHRKLTALGVTNYVVRPRDCERVSPGKLKHGSRGKITCGRRTCPVDEFPRSRARFPSRPTRFYG
jgi:hypothetical protein